MATTEDGCLFSACGTINGDLWHANPNKYKENDILNLRGRQVLASEIWAKDMEKKQLAYNLGYQVVYIWESELK